MKNISLGRRRVSLFSLVKFCRDFSDTIFQFPYPQMSLVCLHEFVSAYEEEQKIYFNQSFFYCIIMQNCEFYFLDTSVVVIDFPHRRHKQQQQQN